MFRKLKIKSHIFSIRRLDFGLARLIGNLVSRPASGDALAPI